MFSKIIAWFLTFLIYFVQKQSLTDFMKQLNLSHALITLFVVYWTAGGEWVLWVANLYQHLQCCYWNVVHTSSHEFVSDKDLKRWQGLVASQKLQCLVRQSTNTKGFKFSNIHLQQHWPLQSQYTIQLAVTKWQCTVW